MLGQYQQRDITEMTLPLTIKVIMQVKKIKVKRGNIRILKIELLSARTVTDESEGMKVGTEGLLTC